jgi:ribose 5-phosphate isomerase A
MTMTADVDAWKRAAAERAVEFVESGMVVGLGTGSTAIWAVRRLGALVADGSVHGIVAVPTSRETADEARRLGIFLDDDAIPSEIDVTIDGADEVDGSLDLIKGGGGALLREKIVAQSSRHEIIVVDETKQVDRLGASRALPVEVVTFGLDRHQRYLERLGATVERRMAGDEPFVTDGGNAILDANFGPIDDPVALASELGQHAGVVEHGLFLGLAKTLVVAGTGGVVIRTR